MPEEEFVLPSRKAQIGFFVFCLLAGIYLLYGNQIWEKQQMWIDTQETLVAIKIIGTIQCVLFSIPFVFLSTWNFFLAKNIRKEKKFPPAMFPVVFKTRVSSGNTVLIKSISACITGFLLLIPPFFWIYNTWLLYQV